MALWLGGGIFVLLSTLVVAELMSITPRSGGPYAMIANAFGPYPGFLIGWTDWLSQCATASLKAVVLMEYVALLVPGMSPWVVPGAIAVNSLFALFQLAGVRLSGGLFQVAATVFGLILIAVSFSLLFGDGGGMQDDSASRVIRTSTGWAHYGIVAAAIVFTYDGWVSASYFSSEVEGGGRSAALGSLKGVLIVIALYLLLNGLLVVNVPLAALEGSELALAGALEYLYGPGAGHFIVLAALVILAAHQNFQYMTASRTLYALSVDGLGSRRATHVGAGGNPTGAVFWSWLVMTLLILAGGFTFLLNMSALLFMVMYVALVVGVFRMRRKAPDLERPYSAWGFPVTGVVCLVGWVAIAGFVALMDIKSAAYSLALVMVSVPVFLWMKSRQRAGTPLHPVNEPGEEL